VKILNRNNTTCYLFCNGMNNKSLPLLHQMKGPLQETIVCSTSLCYWFGRSTVLKWAGYLSSRPVKFNQHCQSTDHSQMYK